MKTTPFKLIQGIAGPEQPPSYLGDTGMFAGIAQKPNIICHE